MAMKTLVLGLLFSSGVFAVKGAGRSDGAGADRPGNPGNEKAHDIEPVDAFVTINNKKETT
jgi:hypothetical protein